MEKAPFNNEDFEIMAYQINILLEGVLYFAGVKKNKLQKAAETYIEIVDDVLENSASAGVDEVIEVVEFMKKNHKELFE